jgi:ElaB/YqjD/DUF883 family membrane-anchored ribosome-binding protein
MGGAGMSPSSPSGQNAGQMPGLSHTAGQMNAQMSGQTHGQMSGHAERSSVTAMPPAGSDDLVHRVARGAHDTVDRLAAKAAPAVERWRTGASSATETLQQRAYRAKELGGEWTESLRGTVREHPLASLGIAAAVGMLLSRLTRR